MGDIKSLLSSTMTHRHIFIHFSPERHEVGVGVLHLEMTEQQQQQSYSSSSSSADGASSSSSSQDTP